MENNEKQMEQWNDVKEKKGSGLIIVLLLLIIIGMGIFIYLNKDKLFEPKTTEPEEEETITFTDTELQEYVDNINPISIGPAAKIYNVDKVVAKELSSREKIEYVGRILFNKKSTQSSDYQYSILSESDVKKIVEETYGENTYERVVFNLGCGDYEFHEDDNSFYSVTGCGGTTNVLVQNVVVSHKATKNKLEITTAYAFADSDNHIYKDYDRTEIIADIDSNEDSVEKVKKYIEEHEEELNHIVYVFESEDGENYYFKEFTNKK